MNAIVIEHVRVEELPQAWRARLAAPAPTCVTVRIEEEPVSTQPSDEGFTTDDPAFGIWADHENMSDVTAYARSLRAPRYNRDGSRNKPKP